MFGGASKDNTIFGELLRQDVLYFGAGNQELFGKTPRDNPLDLTKRNLVLITAGDSNSAGVGPTGYTPNNQLVIDNFNIYDGRKYTTSDPLLGCSRTNLGPGTISSRLTDHLIAGGKFDRVVLVSIGIGGTNTTMWARGGGLENRLPAAVYKLKSRGIVPGPNVTFAIHYQIGANEHGISTADFIANYQDTINRTKVAGFSGYVFVPVYSIIGGIPDANIQAAEMALVDGSTYFAGGNLDTLTGSAFRQADNVHFNTAGQIAAANLIHNAMITTGAF